MLHTTDTTPEPTERHHYETFQICWEGGSRWTGFETLELAWAALQGASREGHIERETWSVDIPLSRLHIYRPGIPADDSHLGC